MQPIISKVFEGIVYSEVYAHFESKNYFAPNQFGFRKQYNTELAVVDLVENIRLAIDRHQVTIVVFVDFSVAFNSLFTSYILSRLLAGGLAKESAICIADSFTGRQFAIIKTDGSLTEWYDYSRGFGQGSRGGGLCYNSSSCEIPSFLTPEYRSHFFADDKTFEIGTSISDIVNAVQTMQTNLDAVMTWAQNCGLCPNPSKCKIMVFGTAQNLRSLNPASLIIKIENTTLERVKEFKYLGIWLDAELNWRRHAANLTSKVFRALRSLSYLRRSLNRETRILVVRALCLTHLDYCSAVLPFADVRTSARCQVALNACVRFIVNVPKFANVSPFRLKLGFMSAANRRLYFSLIVMFKLVVAQFPPILLDTVSLIPHSFNRVGRSVKSIRFILPRNNLSCTSRTFSYGVVKAWNNLPDHIKSSPSLFTFKKKLSSFLISQEVDDIQT